MVSLALLIVLVIAVVAALAVWLSRSSQPSTQNHTASRLRQPSLFDLLIGDIVQYEGRDWVVEGKLFYDDEGFTWLEYMLQDGDDIRWLSVEEDDLVEVALSLSVSSLDINTLPPPQKLEFEGDTYECVESGSAQMRREGSLRRPNVERCRYYDYEGPGHKVLAVEDWDGDIEVTAGRVIRPNSLTLLPGEGRSVYR
ncbi:hypothetical protein XM38_049170 [Halomicronema hongdechloris C2206]|uniref:DUF4178 domain-containing protein n=1 Tax=Halomicronema hongdechloris C2206 TaxID=1641165 RepID=A0A1Z3HUH7_9CYAN|nr:DUF4178 domain-containing protein [Halomicronema hongdechloris]ASC73943.1 hypothetical protein XM38_049170 [Halomicronema hongdechloris C2206]